MCLQFREGHFDWVEIGTVRWEEKKPGAPLPEDGLGLFALMARQVIEDDDVAFLQRWGELSFDIDLEDLFGHRSVDNPRRCQSVAAQSSDESLGFPMSERRPAFKSLTMKRPAA